MGYSRATLSKYLNREYVTTVKVEAALERFFRQSERTATGLKFVPTGVSMAVIDACEYAYRQGKLVILYGPPAIGKTVGAMEFMNRKIAAGIKNLVFVTANSATTPRSVVRRICEELGIPAHRLHAGAAGAHREAVEGASAPDCRGRRQLPQRQGAGGPALGLRSDSVRRGADGRSGSVPG